MDGYEPSDDDGRGFLYPNPMDDINYIHPDEPDDEVYDCPIHGKLGAGIVTGKQIGRASCRERVLRLV